MKATDFAGGVAPALMAPNAVTMTGVVAVALGINLHIRRVEEAICGRFVPGRRPDET